MAPAGEKLPLYSAFGRPGEKVQGSAEEKQSFLNYIPFVKKGRSSSRSASATRASSNTTPSPSEANQPTGGVIGFARSGMAAASGGARSVVSGIQQKQEDAAFLMSSWRLSFFLFFGGMGVFFMFVAFLFLPMIVFAPQKFALLFTFGSICLIASLGIIKGFWPLFEHVTAKERLLYSIAYFTSMFGTIYFSIIAPSYLLVFVSAIVQLVSLVSLLISYVPGGVRFLSFIQGQTVGAAKSMVPGGNVV